MKSCLHCKKQFQEKRDRAKFCSTSCRVMYNRKNPNPQEKVTEVKLQVLYNSLLEMVGAFNEAKGYSIPVGKNVKPTLIEESLPWDEKPTINRKPKSVVKYIEDRLEIDTPEGYEKWLAQLESDPFLSDRDKKAAITNTL